MTYPTLATVDMVCSYIFILDYFLRLLTCWAVSPRYVFFSKIVLNMMLHLVFISISHCAFLFKSISEYRIQYRMLFIPYYNLSANKHIYIIFVSIFLFLSSSCRVAGILSAEWEEKYADDPHVTQPRYPIPYTMLMFAIKFTNIIDFLSILPFFLHFLPNFSNENGLFIRILRLLKIFRVLRLIRLTTYFGNAEVATSLIYETISQAATILSVYVSFVMITVILFGCLIYIVEQGNFTVNMNYPNGAYLRLTHDLSSYEISPFTSIPDGMYWAITTATGTGTVHRNYCIFYSTYICYCSVLLLRVIFYY